MLLIGKPSIFMGHLYHGYVSHNQWIRTLVSPLGCGSKWKTDVGPQMLVELSINMY